MAAGAHSWTLLSLRSFQAIKNDTYCGMGEQRMERG